MWQYRTFHFILILALRRPWTPTQDEVMGSSRCFEEQGLIIFLTISISFLYKLAFLNLKLNFLQKIKGFQPTKCVFFLLFFFALYETFLMFRKRFSPSFMLFYYSDYFYLVVWCASLFHNVLFFMAKIIFVHIFVQIIETSR